MQTGKWQLIRVTFFARARARVVNRISYSETNMANISKHLPLREISLNITKK